MWEMENGWDMGRGSAIVIGRATEFLDGAGCSDRMVCGTPAGLECECVCAGAKLSFLDTGIDELSQFPAMLSRSCRSFSSVDSSHWHRDCRVCVSISK